MNPPPGPESPTRGERGATLSACVITLNEEQRLPGCLASVAFCDEIVVVDSGSQDRTVEIAREHAARVVEQPWLGFGAQRNVAIDHAGGDWILEVDADERVTPELREEIRGFLAAPPAGIDIAGMPLRETFMGARLGPSAKYPRYRCRLFRRGAYRHDEQRTVHEGLWPVGQTWAFAGSLDHLLAGTWREALRDGWAYAGLEAEQSPPPRGPGGYLVRIALRPLAKLAYRVAVDAGWRDGPRGIAKIALDCWSDAAVGVRQLLRRRGGAGSGDGHYARSLQVGAVRVVALALGEESAREAGEWLQLARASGADVGLITDAHAEANAPLRVRAIARTGPLTVIRAIDAEDQLRPIDALLPVGSRARRLVRLLPRQALAAGAVLDAAADPVASERELRLATRGG